MMDTNPISPTAKSSNVSVAYVPMRMSMMGRVYSKACEDLRIPDEATASRELLASIILQVACDSSDEAQVFDHVIVAMKSRYI